MICIRNLPELVEQALIQPDVVCFVAHDAAAPVDPEVDADVDVVKSERRDEGQLSLRIFLST